MGSITYIEKECHCERRRSRSRGIFALTNISEKNDHAKILRLPPVAQDDVFFDSAIFLKESRKLSDGNFYFTFLKALGPVRKSRFLRKEKWEFGGKTFDKNRGTIVMVGAGKKGADFLILIYIVSCGKILVISPQM